MISKKGISGVITVVILVGLVLVAIGIVWVVVQNIIGGNLEEVSVNAVGVNLNVESVKADSDSINVTVKRGVGGGDVSGVKFIVDDGIDTEIFQEDRVIKELEIKIFNLNYSGLVKSVEVAPVFKTESGKEKVGDAMGKLKFSNKEIIENLGGVAWWKFDGNVGDEIGLNDGVSPGTSSYEQGLFRKSLKISDNYFEAPISSSAPSTTTFWFKVTTNTDDIYPNNTPLFLWHQDGANYIHFSLYSYAGGSQAGLPYLQPRGYVTHYYHQAYNFLADQWYFAVFKLDTDRMYLNIYEDGILVDSRTEDQNPGYASYNFIALRLYKFGSECYFDEPIIFNKVLTEKEVKALYELDLS